MEGEGGLRHRLTVQPPEPGGHRADDWSERGGGRQGGGAEGTDGCTVVGDTGGMTSPSPNATGSQLSLGEAKSLETHLVTSIAQLHQWLPKLAGSVRIGVDLETTGLCPTTDRVRLVTLAIPAVTLVVDTWEVCDWSLVLAPLFTDGRILKIFHNAKFDLGFLFQAGIEVTNVFDTMLASQLLDGGRQPHGRMAASAGRTGSEGPAVGHHTLAGLAERELGMHLDKACQVENWGRELTDEMLAYAAADAAILLPPQDRLAANLSADGLERVAGIEFGAVSAVTWMERAGLPIDVAAWTMLRDEAVAEKHRLENQIRALLPGVNLQSSRQLKDALARGGIDVPDTQEATMASVAEHHPVVGLVLQWKGAVKRAGTYGNTYLKHVDSTTGRIHADYRQIGAASGRMACSRPNVQNIPRASGYRDAIKPSRGRVLVKADYSQIELRIVAQLSGDKAMICAFREGKDLHAETARAVLGREPIKDDRQLAKALNFGLVYGMGAKRLREYTATDYGVQLSDRESEEFRERFFRAYPGLRQWHRRQLEGEITTRTLTGRLRRGVDKFTEKLNSPVQGTGADILKLALGRLWEDRGAVTSVVPVAAVHDEILVEVDEGEASRAATWLVEHMEAAGRDLLTDVPVVVEVSIAADWGGKQVRSMDAQSDSDSLDREVTA